MAGLTAHGGTFTFQGFSAAIVGISVETPVAEVVDMTPMTAASNAITLVPTGARAGGSVAVDYLRIQGGTDPATLVAKCDQLSFNSSGYSITTRAILQSASTEARAGDLVRGSLRFVVTDYTGT